VATSFFIETKYACMLKGCFLRKFYRVTQPYSYPVFDVFNDF